MTQGVTYYNNYDKICILCVRYGLSTPPDMFLDHIGGVYIDLCVYFIILIRFYHSKHSNILKYITYIKIIEIKNYVFDIYLIITD